MIYSVAQRDQFSRQGREYFGAAARAERAFLQGPFQPKSTEQTQSRRTPVKSTVARAFLRAGVNPKNETVVIATL